MIAGLYYSIYRSSGFQKIISRETIGLSTCSRYICTASRAFDQAWNVHSLSTVPLLLLLPAWNFEPHLASQFLDGVYIWHCSTLHPSPNYLVANSVAVAAYTVFADTRPKLEFIATWLNNIINFAWLIIAGLVAVSITEPVPLANILAAVDSTTILQNEKVFQLAPVLGYFIIRPFLYSHNVAHFLYPVSSLSFTRLPIDISASPGYTFRTTLLFSRAFYYFQKLTTAIIGGHLACHNKTSSLLHKTFLER